MAWALTVLPLGCMAMLANKQRILAATKWANGPIKWALRFQRPEGFFRPLRRVPLFVLAQLLYWHILLLKK